MKKFVVERNLPGAENLTPEELQFISKTFCEAIDKLRKPHHWIQSFVTTDKIYCIHIAESIDAVREHARLGKIPVHTISEVKTVIDPLTSYLILPPGNYRNKAVTKPVKKGKNNSVDTEFVG